MNEEGKTEGGDYESEGKSRVFNELGRFMGGKCRDLHLHVPLSPISLSPAEEKQEKRNRIGKEYDVAFFPASCIFGAPFVISGLT